MRNNRAAPRGLVALPARGSWRESLRWLSDLFSVVARGCRADGLSQVNRIRRDVGPVTRAAMTDQVIQANRAGQDDSHAKRPGEYQVP